MTNKDNKRIYIFMRDYLMMGGIETYIYSQAKKIKALGHKVIWIKSRTAKIDESFKSVFYDGSTVVWNKKKNYKIDTEEIKRLVDQGYNEIVFIGFNVHSLICAEHFKRVFKLCPVHTFYFVPNFVGEVLYPEDEYSGKKRDKVRLQVAPIMRKLHHAGNLRYFSVKHIERMTASYDYQIKDDNSYYFVPPDTNPLEFDENRARILATRERFNLLSVSRFDFPHKGYLLGLIRAYGEVKTRYPHLEFTIVGYGRDRDKVEAEINKLPDEIKSSIRIVGPVSPEELTAYYDDANLNISIAGCCSKGAKNGTLSIAARHFDYSCEVYGFLSKENRTTISDEPGENVVPYIEKVLNMDADEYCRRCREGFEVFINESLLERTPINLIKNLSPFPTLTSKEISFMKRLERTRLFRCKLRAIKRVVCGKLKP